MRSCKICIFLIYLLQVRGYYLIWGTGLMCDILLFLVDLSKIVMQNCFLYLWIHSEFHQSDIIGSPSFPSSAPASASEAASWVPTPTPLHIVTSQETDGGMWEGWDQGDCKVQPAFHRRCLLWRYDFFKSQLVAWFRKFQLFQNAHCAMLRFLCGFQVIMTRPNAFSSTNKIIAPMWFLRKQSLGM